MAQMSDEMMSDEMMSDEMMAEETVDDMDHSPEMAEELADIVDIAVGAGSFTTLVAAVEAAGLVDTLNSQSSLPLMMPLLLYQQAQSRVFWQTLLAL